MKLENLCAALNQIENKDMLVKFLRERVDMSRFGEVAADFGVRDCGTMSLLGFLNDCLRASGSHETLVVVLDGDTDKILGFEVKKEL
jgi:hypothetical protein